MASTSEVERHRGQWVAYDDTNDKVMLAANSAAELYEMLERDPQPGTVVWRIPRLDDPLFIGLD